MNQRGQTKGVKKPKGSSLDLRLTHNYFNLSTMSRPLRIEYENAIYHVMNRGRGHMNVFHDKRYHNAFFKCLAEANQRFGLDILAYCLMSNHYHLLLKTPRANLSRCMRHIDGLYTQRHNLLKQTDGPLFRGRYKAILVEHGEYLLAASRYIHRNPIQTNKPLVSKLEQYEASSYPFYIGDNSPPQWLTITTVLDCLSVKRKYSAYRLYVENSSDDELIEFYHTAKIAPILGSNDFKDQVKQHRIIDAMETAKYEQSEIIPPTIIIKRVAEQFKINEKEILYPRHGKYDSNDARKIAIYLCRELSNLSLKEIAKIFNLKSYSSVSQSCRRLTSELCRDESLNKILKRIIRKLT